MCSPSDSSPRRSASPNAHIGLRDVWLLLTRRHPNPCLARAEMVYALGHSINPRATWRVCLMLSLDAGGTWGHAWVTRNGRKVAARQREIGYRLVEMGDDGKYTYYITEQGVSPSSADGDGG